MPSGRPLGHVESGSSLGETQTDEIAEFDEFGLQRVFSLEPVQSNIQSNQIFTRLGDGCRIKIEHLTLHRAAMSRRGLPASIVDEDASHGFGSGGEEVAAVVPLVATGSPN